MTAATMRPARVREVPLGPADVEVEHRPDGAILLRSPHALSRYPEKLTERLLHWARETPARCCIAQRDAAGGWRKLSYADAHRRVRAIGQALLERDLSRERPLAILSDNDIEHALLALACMHVGIAYVPVSSAYSLVSTDHAKLKYVMGLLTPGLVYATDGARFARAIAAAVPAGTEVLTNSVPLKKREPPAGWTKRTPRSARTRSPSSC
jgi:feruloyl-CoA synthase